MAPTAEELTRADSICTFLGPFAVITKMMSGSIYPTANLYFYQVWLIHDWLRNNEESDDEIIRDMVSPMKEEFDKYWDDVNGVFAMAAVFDPRFKLSLFDCCLGKLDMSTRDIKLKNLRKRFRILFKSYDKKSKTNSPSTEPRETGGPPTCEPASAGISHGAVSGKTPKHILMNHSLITMNSFQSLDILDFWKDNTHRYGYLAARLYHLAEDEVDGEEEKPRSFESIVSGDEIEAQEV
ncbi:hypothetical protein Bca101_067436 [Brassica carinata]